MIPTHFLHVKILIILVPLKTPLKSRFKKYIYVIPTYVHTYVSMVHVTYVYFVLLQIIGVDPYGSILAQPDKLNVTDVTSYHVSHYKYILIIPFN